MSIEKRNQESDSSFFACEVPSSPRLSLGKKDQQHVSNKTNDKNDNNNNQDYEVITIPSFDDLGVTDQLLRGIYAYGFEKPSAIQQKGIKPIMGGRDVIVQAQSGTGKTATFLIGTISQLDLDQKKCQVCFQTLLLSFSEPILLFPLPSPFFYFLFSIFYFLFSSRQ